MTAVTTCTSCGHDHTDPADTISDLDLMWSPTGHRVCRDGESCFARILAQIRVRGGGEA